MLTVFDFGFYSLLYMNVTYVPVVFYIAKEQSRIHKEAVNFYYQKSSLNIICYENSDFFFCYKLYHTTGIPIPWKQEQENHCNFQAILAYI